MLQDALNEIKDREMLRDSLNEIKEYVKWRESVQSEVDLTKSVSEIHQDFEHLLQRCERVETSLDSLASARQNYKDSECCSWTR